GRPVRRLGRRRALLRHPRVPAARAQRHLGRHRLRLAHGAATHPGHARHGPGRVRRVRPGQPAACHADRQLAGGVGRALSLAGRHAIHPEGGAGADPDHRARRQRGAADHRDLPSGLLPAGGRHGRRPAGHAAGADRVGARLPRRARAGVAPHPPALRGALRVQRAEGGGGPLRRRRRGGGVRRRRRGARLPHPDLHGLLPDAARLRGGGDPRAARHLAVPGGGAGRARLLPLVERRRAGAARRL
ncbi:MAG: Hydroxymethylpyrimidine ABC transporter, transmembrane component, partial [uncultured Acetobacteraceae bacterium]